MLPLLTDKFIMSPKLTDKFIMSPNLRTSKIKWDVRKWGYPLISSLTDISYVWWLAADLGCSCRLGVEQGTSSKATQPFRPRGLSVFNPLQSSICSWAYASENLLSPTASKISPCVIYPTDGLGVISCRSFVSVRAGVISYLACVRVMARGDIMLHMSKGKV